MKIFYFSTVFAPSVGGIEKMVEVLCSEFVSLGHDVRLATLTPGGNGSPWPFKVIRQPSPAQFIHLLRWSDVHVQANVSLKYGLARVVQPRAFVYNHQNVYQRDDGSLDLRGRLKGFLARRTPGIANSRYTAGKLGCSRIVFNAYDDSTFRDVVPWQSRDRDLAFLGRLVRLKGCAALLGALGRLRREGFAPNLTVIGDGPDRAMLEGLAAREGIAEQVHFAGWLQGERLTVALNRHRVLVVPSSYEEPFGIVALEGLACGCLPVVSERGGLVDAIGPHGFTFPNGDDAALASTLAAVLADAEAAQSRLAGKEAHLAGFTARAVATRFIGVFDELLGRQ
jgi:glycosyltransferase involved in cell wall biosynthesis